MLGRVGIICTLIFQLVVLSQNVSCEENISLPPDEPETTPTKDDIPEMQQPVKKQNLVTIDLSECTCTSTSSCELTILKTPLVDITCGDEESLCCSMVPSTQPSESTKMNHTTEILDEPTAVAPRSNVRVYSITPYIFKDFNASSDASSSRKQWKNKSKKCGCKTRGSCPHKYIDYGFGFYCTYNTVRCCLPDESMEEAETLATENEKIPETSATSDSVPNPDRPDSMPSADVENAGSALDMESNNAPISEMSSAAEGDSETTSENLMDGKEEFTGNESFPTTTMEVASNTAAAVELTVDESISANEEEQGDKTEAAATGGELVITEVTNWSSGLEEGEDDYAKEGDCFCMSIEKCRMTSSYDSTNMIERRRDTLCPADLIQCCRRDLLDEITKKRDEVAGEYDTTVPVRADNPESSSPQTSQHVPSSDAFPQANDTIVDEAPEAPLITKDLPSPSILPVPYPGYQPPGFYKGYTGSQHPTNSYSTGGQQVVQNNQPYRYNVQPQTPQQSPSQYEINGGNDYNRPWMYSKYTPQYNNEQLQRGPYQPRNPYPDNGTARHKPGGLFETLSKYLG